MGHGFKIAEAGTLGCAAAGCGLPPRQKKGALKHSFDVKTCRIDDFFSSKNRWQTDAYVIHVENRQE
ncbi:hypothetical protein K5M36_05755 [Chromobacterium vaccinii]|nr:hypothetical protein [Chromobacterium vaccinii]